MSHSPNRLNFRLGEQSDVYIIAGAKKDVPSLPAAAIVTRDKKRGVWTMADGRLSFKPVTVGIEDRKGFTEITGGINGGERIAMAPAPEMAKFNDGMKVSAK